MSLRDYNAQDVAATLAMHRALYPPPKPRTSASGHVLKPRHRPTRRQRTTP